MSREIKFRAWNTDDGVMITDLNSPRLHHGRLISDEADILMQFTGLHDCNGKEIYEGDILEAEAEREDEYGRDIDYLDRFHVVFEDGGFHRGGGDPLFFYVDEFEVIGNIYENPDLLETAA